MKTASILLRHPIDRAETLERAKSDIILGKVAPYKSILLGENPDAILCDYVIAPQYQNALLDLTRLSTWAVAIQRASGTSISGIMYDTPINYGPASTDANRHAQLSMLAEIQGTCPGTIYTNVVSPALLIQGPPAWEPWCARLKNVATAYFIECWELSRTTQEMIAAINDIEKPMVIAFRRDNTLTSERAQGLAVEYAQELDAPNRYFTYRDGSMLWINSPRIETWQFNDIFRSSV